MLKRQAPLSFTSVQYRAIVEVKPQDQSGSGARASAESPRRGCYRAGCYARLRVCETKAECGFQRLLQQFRFTPIPEILFGRTK